MLYQWDSLDHVALGSSYSAVARRAGVPWDYFHVNSIEPQSDGNVLISARNTSQIYDVSGSDGSIKWSVGGKQPTFRMGANTPFYFQHDARLHNGDILTKSNTATLVSQFFHTPALKAPAEGNTELLGNGDQLVSWGQAPFTVTIESSWEGSAPGPRVSRAGTRAPDRGRLAAGRWPARRP